MSVATRRYVLLLSAALVCALPTATLAAHPCDDQPIRLTAVWYDVTEHFRDGGAGAADELRQRFCEIGVNTDWRRARPGEPYGSSTGLEIPVAILGSHPLQSRVPRPIMGEVPERWSGPGPRPVRVYVEGIRAALGLDPLGARTEMTMRLAVGRVAAHEMIHALAPAQGHASEGLMSSRLGREALVGKPPGVAGGHVIAVRAALRIGIRRPAVSIAESVRIEPLYAGDDSPGVGSSLQQ